MRILVVEDEPINQRIIAVLLQKLGYDVTIASNGRQAVDAFAFLQINQIPHTRLLDRFMTRLSWVMTGGTGWLLFLLLATPRGSSARL